MKTILIIVQHGLFNTAENSGALDMILGASAYQYQVTVVFQGEGVTTLNPQQDHVVGVTDLLKPWRALPHYEVTKLYAVESEQLSQASPDWILPVQLISNTRVQELIAQHDIVLTF